MSARRPATRFRRHLQSSSYWSISFRFLSARECFFFCCWLGASARVSLPNSIAKAHLRLCGSKAKGFSQIPQPKLPTTRKAIIQRNGGPQMDKFLLSVTIYVVVSVYIENKSKAAITQQAAAIFGLDSLPKTRSIIFKDLKRPKVCYSLE